MTVVYPGRLWMQLWKWWEACLSNGAMLPRHLQRLQNGLPLEFFFTLDFASERFFFFHICAYVLKDVWNIETLGRCVFRNVEDDEGSSFWRGGKEEAPFLASQWLVAWAYPKTPTNQSIIGWVLPRIPVAFLEAFIVWGPNVAGYIMIYIHIYIYIIYIYSYIDSVFT